MYKAGNFPLVGNSGVAGVVRDAFDNLRIPHAVIIEGEEGTGKHTLAGYFAAAAVCPSEFKPCGVCKSCHIAEVGSHPDISKITPEDGKKTISVDAVRSLRTEAYLKPNISDRRVFIIDPADALSDISQNALLKVLEEPPKSAVFVLITNTAAGLLPTIRSRCVKLTLTPVDLASAEKYILENTVGFSGEDISNAVAEAGGNIGSALKILEGGGEIHNDAKELISLSEKNKAYEMLLIFKKYERDRVRTAELFECMRFHLLKRLKQSVGGEPNLMSDKKIAEMYDIIGECKKRLEFNINLPLLFSYFCSNIK